MIDRRGGGGGGGGGRERGVGWVVRCGGLCFHVYIFTFLSSCII